jgi:hypothetical protein
MLKTTATVVVDGRPLVGRIDTVPPGAFWLQVDRRGEEHIITLRAKSSLCADAEVARFNSYTLASSAHGLVERILEKLNSEVSHAEQ